jgi:hypothetical protein
MSEEETEETEDTVDIVGEADDGLVTEGWKEC